jgi:hypothetical protein
LQVIGAGFGRTGTLSLKTALETIGFGPCYHMLEVARQPGHAQHWIDALDGLHDFHALFEGYAASVDWPGCHFWRELADLHPEARVVLSLRDPERWYESVASTIYRVMTAQLPADVPEGFRIQQQMVRRMVLEETFEGRFEDRAHTLDVFRRHNETVQRTIAQDRLLIYEVSEGWETLCRFLDRPIPKEDFPRLNDSKSFTERFSGALAEPGEGDAH